MERPLSALSQREAASGGCLRDGHSAIVRKGRRSRKGRLSQSRGGTNGEAEDSRARNVDAC